MSQPTTTIWQRLPEPLRRDPKKSAMLAGLLVLMAVLGIRQYTGMTTPASARAALPLAERSASSNSAVSRGTSNPSNEVAQRVAQWLGTPIKALDRNLFETKLEFFQRLDGSADDRAAVLAEETFWDQLAKSLASQADQKRQKQIRSENLQLAASSFKLQTTLMGSVPKALIDGRMVRMGDTLESKGSDLSMVFRVVQIEPRRVVIERDGVKIELKMGVGHARVISE